MLTKKYSPSTERIRKKRERLMDLEPSICVDRAIAYTESFKATEAKPPIIRNAMAFDHYLSTVGINIGDDELLVVNAASRPMAAPIFIEYGASWILEELDTIHAREADPYKISEKDKEVLRDILPFWNGKTYQDTVLQYYTEDAIKAQDMVALIQSFLHTGADGHYTPGYEMVIQKGLNAIIKEAEKELKNLDLGKKENFEKSLFLKALIITDKAAIKFAERYSKLAKEKALKENDTNRKAELNKIAEVCARVPAEPARDFWEAMQCQLFLQTMVQMESNGHSINTGRVDQYVYPFYKKDLEEGKLTKEQAQEIVEMWWLKLGEMTKVQQAASAAFFRGYQVWQQLTLGGIDKNGNDASNDLTYAMLDATANMKMTKPSVSVRIHRNTPEKLWMKVLEVNEAHGGGMPALYNDEVAIPSIHNGYPNLTIDDARNWDVVGCVEMAVSGKSTSSSTHFAFWNAGKVLEMAMFGGKDPFSGLELGPKNPDMLKWKTPEDMMAAWNVQQEYYCKLYSEMTNTLAYVRRLKWELPFVSSLFEGVVKSGKSHINNGIQSNPGSSPGMVGIANAANSLAAIKKVVFDDKSITMAQFKHALETNYDDMSTNPTGPEIQQLCLKAPKYGNDDNFVDNIVMAITSQQADILHSLISISGAPHTSALLPVTGHIPLGGVVNALPDGRKAGKPLAEGCSPTQGSDIEGWTAAINSVSKIDQVKHDGGTLYNVKIDPKAVSTKAGMQKWADAIKTYFRRGGFHVQFNVVSRETLLAAQERPQDYRDLVVRVAGYSAFFVQQDRALQDDIIARTEQRV